MTTLISVLALFGPAHAMSGGIDLGGSYSAAADLDPLWADLAFHHAPVHYQDTDSTCEEADYLTAYDYDGNVDAEDNWENLFDFPRNAVVYWSVAETCTHWFITYGFFHPRDWADSSFDAEHENDLEGALLIVERDGSPFGVARGAISVAHTDFYSWASLSSPLTDGVEDIDGTLWTTWDGSHLRPITAQESKGHGLYAYGNGRTDFDGNTGEDGVIYFPSQTVSEEPSDGDDRHVSYTLVPLLDSLWAQQLTELDVADADALTYHDFGKMQGNGGGTCGDGITIVCTDDSANMPWRWDDSDDTMPGGMLGLDPATIVAEYFDGHGDVSDVYTYNPMVRDLRDRGYGATTPDGFPSGLDLAELTGRLTTAQCLDDASLVLEDMVLY